MSVNLPLTPALAELLREQLATGRYPTASDAVEAALRLLDDRTDAVRAGPDQAFGLWRERGLDGLAYQEALRSEWGV